MRFRPLLPAVAIAATSLLAPLAATAAGPSTGQRDSQLFDPSVPAERRQAVRISNRIVNSSDGEVPVNISRLRSNSNDQASAKLSKTADGKRYQVVVRLKKAAKVVGITIQTRDDKYFVTTLRYGSDRRGVFVDPRLASDPGCIFYFTVYTARA